MILTDPAGVRECGGPFRKSVSFIYYNSLILNIFNVKIKPILSCWGHTYEGNVDHWGRLVFGEFVFYARFI